MEEERWGDRGENREGKGRRGTEGDTDMAEKDVKRELGWLVEVRRVRNRRDEEKGRKRG